MKTTRPAWLIAMLLLVMMAVPSAASATETAGPSAGKVNFAKAAQSDFDQYLLGTSSTRKQWMNQNYWRMRAYAPFFDARTDWYGRGWAYENAYAIYRGWEGDDARFILKDASGNRLYIPFACNGQNCSQYAADIGDPGWRANFINRAKARIARGYRGMFVDDVNFAFNVSDGAGNLVAPRDPRTGRTMTHTDWQRYMAEFMEQLRAELPQQAEIVQNQVYFHVGLSSPYVKRAIDASTHIEVERGFNDTGITGGNGWFGYETVMAWVDYIHSRGKGVVYDVQSNWGREYALGNYFLTSTGNDGLGMDDGGTPDNFWNGFASDLGAPLNQRYKWNGLFRRDFENGTVLVNQPGSPSRTVTPGGRVDRHVRQPAHVGHHRRPRRLGPEARLRRAGADARARRDPRPHVPHDPRAGHPPERAQADHGAEGRPGRRRGARHPQDRQAGGHQDQEADRGRQGPDRRRQGQRSRPHDPPVAGSREAAAQGRQPLDRGPHGHGSHRLAGPLHRPRQRPSRRQVQGPHQRSRAERRAGMARHAATGLAHRPHPGRTCVQ